MWALGGFHARRRPPLRRRPIGGVGGPGAMEKYRQLSSGGLDEAEVAAALQGAGAGSVATGKLVKVWHGMGLSEGVALVLSELVREEMVAGTLLLR